MRGLRAAVRRRATRARTTRSPRADQRVERARVRRGWRAPSPACPSWPRRATRRPTRGSPRRRRAWFVDPLDGTREFVAKNGEFAVMIGLAERGRATARRHRGAGLGAARSSASWARARGRWRPTARARRSTSSPRATLDGRDVRRVAVARAASALDGHHRAASARSRLALTAARASRRALVATGEADVYLQPGEAGMRWDACATEALVRAAGGELHRRPAARPSTTAAPTSRTRAASSPPTACSTPRSIDALERRRAR